MYVREGGNMEELGGDLEAAVSVIPGRGGTHLFEKILVPVLASVQNSLLSSGGWSRRWRCSLLFRITRSSSGQTSPKVVLRRLVLLTNRRK